MKKKVLIPTKLDKAAREILAATGKYEVIQDDATELAVLAGKHPDTYALIVRSEKVTKDIINALPKLKVVVRAGAGVDTIDTKHARRKGVDVMNTPGANSNAVAEEVVAMMLADARQIVEADASCRAGKWEKKRFMGREIAGKTVGIVGLGNIGRLVAKRLSGFECRVLGYDPMISADRARDMNVEPSDIETLFAKCDYVSLHLPENDETRGLVGERLLAKMKDGATLINCARAGVVDENALRTLKKTKKIRFLNDVYPKDAEGRKSVEDIADLMLPHLGASTYEANFNAAKRAVEQLVDLDQKGVTTFIVNRDIPEGLDEKFCTLANTLARLSRSLADKGTALKMIETSFYGTLAPYGEWLLGPIVAGIWDEFDRSMDPKATRKWLSDMGIEAINRQTDPTKTYGNSITVDLTSAVDAGNLRRVSVRGTVTEGNVIVSRINNFDKLYFEPTGNILVFIYVDRPGVIGTIGSRLAAQSVNIEEMRNSFDPISKQSLVLMRVNSHVVEDLLQSIAREIQAVTACALTI